MLGRGFALTTKYETTSYSVCRRWWETRLLLKPLQIPPSLPDKYPADYASEPLTLSASPVSNNYHLHLRPSEVSCGGAGGGVYTLPV